MTHTHYQKRKVTLDHYCTWHVQEVWKCTGKTKVGKSVMFIGKYVIFCCHCLICCQTVYNLHVPAVYIPVQCSTWILACWGCHRLIYIVYPWKLTDSLNWIRLVYLQSLDGRQWAAIQDINCDCLYNLQVGENKDFIQVLMGTVNTWLYPSLNVYMYCWTCEGAMSPTEIYFGKYAKLLYNSCWCTFSTNIWC